MILEKDMIPDLLKKLDINHEIEDATQILELVAKTPHDAREKNRVNKWSYGLLLLSYLIKQNDFSKIKDFVDFAFSKENNESIFQRFRLRQLLKGLQLPEKWFTKEEKLIPGAKRARNIPCKREDLFRLLVGTKSYTLTSNARKLALILYISLLNATEIPFEQRYIAFELEEEPIRDKDLERVYLTDESGIPTELYEEVIRLIDEYPELGTDQKFTEDTGKILHYVQDSLMQLLLRNKVAYEVTPRKLKRKIKFQTKYNLDVFSDSKGNLQISKWIDDYCNNGQESEETDETISSPILVLGSAGSGKSFWLIHQAANIWNRFTDSKDNSPIPIFVELGRLTLKKGRDGELLQYGDNGSILWYTNDNPSEVSRGELRDYVLGSMLEKPSKSLRKRIEEANWEDKRFVILLDGWDELGIREKGAVKEFILTCHENRIPCIITSRLQDTHIEQLDAEIYFICQPTREDWREYLIFRGMEEAIIDKIEEWFPEPSPLDLEILGSVPKLKELPYGRVLLYRTWVELQVITRAGAEICRDLESRSDITQVLKEHIFEEKTLETIIRGGEPGKSLWDNITHIAYLQSIGRHTSLDYDQYVIEIPLIDTFVEAKENLSDSPYPEISRNHLIPFLSAEYIFRQYLQGKYVSLNGDGDSFRFLIEILSVDKKRNKMTVQSEMFLALTPNELAIMIHLQAESGKFTSGETPTNLTLRIYNQENLLESIHKAYFRAFVRYWNDLQDDETRKYILKIYSYIVERVVLQGLDFEHEKYIIPILEMEEKLGNVSIVDLLSNEEDEKDYLRVKDAEGFYKYSLDKNLVDEFLISISLKKNWLIPWLVRVLNEENLSRIPQVLENISEEIIFEVVRYCTDDFSSFEKNWIDSLRRNASRLNSKLLWNALAYCISRRPLDIDDWRFHLIMDIFASKLVDDKWKRKIITSLNKFRLSEKHTQEIWKDTIDGRIAPKYGLAIGIAQEQDELDIDDIFSAISQEDNVNWLELLLPGVLSDTMSESEVNERFKKIDYSVLRVFTRLRLSPWDYQRFQELIEIWWESNLASVEGALEIVQKITSDRRDTSLQRIDYRESETLLIVANWLKKQKIPIKKKFFRSFISSNLDMTDTSVRKYLYPIYKDIENREDLDDLLVEQYPKYLRGFSTLPLSRKSWAKYIDRVEREEILSWSYLMEIYLDAGNVRTIEGAIKLFDEIYEENGMIETTETLFNWIQNRPISEISLFVYHLLDLASNQDFNDHQWYMIRKSELIGLLVPIDQKAPDLYKKIIRIFEEALESSIDRRMEIEFLFKYLSPIEQIRITKPYFMKRFEKDGILFSKTDVDKLIFLHGNDSDIEMLVDSLDSHPRPMGDIWSEKPDLAEAIFDKLTNPLARLLFQIDRLGGTDKYFEFIDKHPEKAETHFITFLENSWIDFCYLYFEKSETLRSIATKYWKRVFKPRDMTGPDMDYLGFLFQEDDREIIRFIASRIDQEHKKMEKAEETYPDRYRGHSHSMKMRVLDKIEERTGFSGLLRILSYVKHPYSVESVLMYLARIAKSEGRDRGIIEERKEFKTLSRKTKWYILKKFDES